MTRYLLDSTVLIAHLRGDDNAIRFFFSLLKGGHVPSTTCVNVAEVEYGAPVRGQKDARSFLERLAFLPTTKEAAIRAGRYRAEWKAKGKMIAVPDALIAGTARVHGAVLVTNNVKDFPMPDIRIERLPLRAD